jgi:hypothetical protein
MGKDIGREVQLALAPRLEALELTKKKHRYVLSFEGGFGWVHGAMTPYPHPRVLVVDLHTGVWLEAIERLRHELEGSEESAGETTARHYVSSLARATGIKLNPWKVSYDASNEEIEEVAQSLAAAVRDYAIPFIESHSDLRSLMIAMMKEYLLEFPQQRVRMTIGFHLLRDEERARELLDDTIAGLGDRSDPAAEKLRAFASAYHARFG